MRTFIIALLCATAFAAQNPAFLEEEGVVEDLAGVVGDVITDVADIAVDLLDFICLLRSQPGDMMTNLLAMLPESCSQLLELEEMTVMEVIDCIASLGEQFVGIEVSEEPVFL